jgi:hypothetical protein
MPPVDDHARTILAPFVAAAAVLAPPQVNVPNDEANRRLKRRHRLLWLVFVVVPRRFFRKPDGAKLVDYRVRQLGDVKGGLRVAAKPRIVVGGQQHDIVTAMIRDDYRFPLRQRPVPAELTLKLARGNFRQEHLPFP